MTGAGDRPRSFAELQKWVRKELVALNRRQLPRSATIDRPVAVTALTAAGMTIGAGGASVQRVNGFTHVRAHVERAASETGLLFILPSGTWPAVDEWAPAHAGGSPRGMVSFLPNGEVRLDDTVSPGSFVFSHTFPSVPDAP